MMPLTRLAETPAVATPAATMRTYTSSATDPETAFAMWRTEIPAGTAGPVHSVDVDHYVVVVDGTVEVRLGREQARLEAGDGLRIPAGVARQIAAAHSAPAVTLTAGIPGGRATVGDNDPVRIPWS